MAVLSLAQTIELSVKAALVEQNVSIYDSKGGTRTLNPHDALQALSKTWSVERLHGHSRIEILIDERNAIQHRYGSIDEVTLDYHMQTAFDFLREVLKREFDTDLADWIKDNVDKEIWERIRFVAGEDGEPQTPSKAMLPDRSPVLDFIDGFSRYEKSIRTKIADEVGLEHFSGSTLDVVLKSLSNLEYPDNSLIKAIPIAYKLRNQLVHGEGDASSVDVKQTLEALDAVINAFRNVPANILHRAVQASEAGHRGTRIGPTEQNRADG